MELKLVRSNLITLCLILLPFVADCSLWMIHFFWILVNLGHVLPGLEVTTVVCTANGAANVQGLDCRYGEPKLGHPTGRVQNKMIQSGKSLN